MRLVLIHIPRCDRSGIESTLDTIALPHHGVLKSWLYPKSSPSVQVGWPDGPGWPQTAEAEDKIVEALGSDHYSLQISMSVDSNGGDVLALCADVLRSHGGVAQIELNSRLWALADLESDGTTREFLDFLAGPQD